MAALTPLLLFAIAPPLPVPGPGELAGWATAALERLRADFLLPETRLYADKLGERGPAFCWGAGVLLPALNAAATHDASYEPALREYADAMLVYWNDQGPVPGFDVLPCPKPVDRYYDDNAWVVIAYLETARVLGDERYVEVARRTMAYVLSGEDEALGGGIYWRESDKASKNTCSNAPAAVAAYLLYRETGEEAFREAGDRLLGWTLATLRDPEDGLMWDCKRLDGSYDRTKWSYNTALTIRALAQRSELTGTTEERSRDRAEAFRMADAAVARWIHPDTGAFRDGGRFAHLLAEALLALRAEDGSQPYREKVLRGLAYLHAEVRDPATNRYGTPWDRPFDGAPHGYELLEQAAAVRALYLAAEEPLGEPRG